MVMKELEAKTAERKSTLSPADEDLLIFEQKQRRAKRNIGLVIGAVMLLAAAAAAIIGGTYISGLVRYNNEEYDEAKGVFERLAFIPVFDEMAKLCDYSLGRDLLEEGRYAEAYELFCSLEGFNGAEAIASDLVYDMAVGCFGNGDYYEAWVMFDSISEYRDSAECALKARYAYAYALFRRDQFEDAEKIFAELGDYNDSQQRTVDCIIGRGIELYRDGNYTAALEVLDPYYFDNPMAEAYCHLCNFRDDCRFAGVGFNSVLNYYYMVQRYSDMEDFEGLTADPMFHVLRFFDAVWSDGKGFVIKATKDDTIEVELEISNLPWRLIEIADDDVNNVFTCREDDGLYVYMGSYNWFRIVSFSSYDTLEPEWVIIEDMGGNPYKLYRES